MRQHSAMFDLSTFDLRALPPAFFNDPYPFYHALREQSPIRKMPDGSLLLTRYGDCVEVYRNTSTFSSDKKKEFAPKFGDSPLFEHHTTSLVFSDPPLHTRVRKLIMGALSTRALAVMEDQVTSLVRRLLDDMERACKSGKPIDFVADFAAAIPIDVIGNLLGVPHHERGPLRGWSLAILGALEPQLTAQQRAAGNKAVTDFLAYLELLVADRRANPGERESDLLTRLIDGEIDGEKLSHKELLHNCIFILNAGHETTTNIIANAIVLFDRFPGQRKRILQDPTLIEIAVEECLRFESPNQLGNRIATRDCSLGGTAIKAGQFITLCIGAANRDPNAFDDPDTFDITRKPNRHLAFASGPHQCAGMHVARLEASIALSELLKRFGRYQLTASSKRSQRARFRGFQAVPGTL